MADRNIPARLFTNRLIYLQVCRFVAELKAEALTNRVARRDNIRCDRQRTGRFAFFVNGNRTSIADLAGSLAIRFEAEAAHPRPEADEAASATVRWFWPADFDVSDDSPEARQSTGWFWKAPDFWSGPYVTSSAAAEAQAKGETK